jgi:hypothetical protein
VCLKDEEGMECLLSLEGSWTRPQPLANKVRGCMDLGKLLSARFTSSALEGDSKVIFSTYDFFLIKRPQVTP